MIVKAKPLWHNGSARAVREHPRAWPTRLERADMLERTCSFPDCTRARYAHGWCRLHHRRLEKYGDPAFVPPPGRRKKDVLERAMAKVVKHDSGCWEWQGATSRGYGYIWDNNQGRAVPVHRAVYEALVGPIPDGLHIDHLCRNRSCVNPGHLEPVTQRENSIRGYGMSGIYARRTHCNQGHAFSEENTAFGADGRRICRTCKREWVRRSNRNRYLKQQAARAALRIDEA